MIGSPCQHATPVLNRLVESPHLLQGPAGDNHPAYGMARSLRPPGDELHRFLEAGELLEVARHSDHRLDVVGVLDES